MASRSKVEWVSLAVRVALGGLFIFAGVMKLKDVQHFVQAVSAFKIIPQSAEHLSVLTAFVVPWVEILAGALLVVGWWTRAAGLVLSAMLAAFITGILSVIVRGLDVKCTCFGEFEIPCTGPIGWCHVIRNTVLLAMALHTVWHGAGKLGIDGRARQP
jgi:putative oxidoreductase